jgi:putative transposase
MARLPRLVVPGLPHHVTQRGNGGARTFFNDRDYALYRDLLAEACVEAAVEVWAWVLMPNHVHLVMVPADPDGLRRVLSRVHRFYAGHIHLREERTGHFWQGRFGSVAMDEAHLLAAVRYIALNPVRAGLTEAPQGWRWSSVHAHLTGEPDGLTAIAPVRERVPDVAAFLAAPPDEAAFERLRRGESVGRPVGGTAFLEALEERAGRVLLPAKRGPKERRELSAASPK